MSERRATQGDLTPGTPGEVVVPIADVRLTETSRVRVEWVTFRSGLPGLRLSLWTMTAEGTFRPRSWTVIPVDHVATFADAVATAVPLARQAQREEDQRRTFRHRRFPTS